jgi:hypothetical protein
MSIAAIVIGVGPVADAFNRAAEEARVQSTDKAINPPDAVMGGEVMADCLCGFAGIVLGVLALVGIDAATLLAAALIVFGDYLLLSGIIGMGARVLSIADATDTQMASYPLSAAASGAEILIGLTAIVLGLLSLILVPSSGLVLVGFLTVGAALLLVSATIGGGHGQRPRRFILRQ